MDENKNIFKLAFFGNAPIKYCAPKRILKKTFHKSIQGNNNFIFKYFDLSYYNENILI